MTAPETKPKRRGFRRLLTALALLVLYVVGYDILNQKDIVYPLTEHQGGTSSTTFHGPLPLRVIYYPLLVLRLKERAFLVNRF